MSVPEHVPSNAGLNQGTFQTSRGGLLDSAAEALSALTCPYYLAQWPDEPPREGRYGLSTCGGGCHQEPSCITDSPTGGWEKQLLDAARLLSEDTAHV